METGAVAPGDCLFGLQCFVGEHCVNRRDCFGKVLKNGCQNTAEKSYMQTSPPER